MSKKHEADLSLDINNRDSWEKHNELKCWFIEILDHNVGLLLCEHSLFSSYRDPRATSQCDYSEGDTRVFGRLVLVNKLAFSVEKASRWMAMKKTDFGKVMELLGTRSSENSVTTSNGKLFFWQARAGTGTTYTMQLFQKCTKWKGHIFWLLDLQGLRPRFMEIAERFRGYAG